MYDHNWMCACIYSATVGRPLWPSGNFGKWGEKHKAMWFGGGWDFTASVYRETL